MPQLKLIGAAILLALVGAGLWYLYHTGYEAGKDAVQVQWDADKIQRDEAQKTALLAYANRINQSEVQHDKDQALIDQLHDDARGLRIHLPACPGNAAAPGPDQNGGPGAFSARVDESFARLQERAGQLFARCDQLNIDARRLNGELK